MEVVAEVHSNLSLAEFDWIVPGRIGGICKNRILRAAIIFLVMVTFLAMVIFLVMVKSIVNVIVVVVIMVLKCIGLQIKKWHLFHF